MSKEFQDSVIPGLIAEAAERPSNLPPPLYVKVTGTKADLMRADSDEEAKAVVQRQVRSGQTPMVCVYKLLFAEQFEPSSVTLTPEELLAQYGPQEGA